MSTKLLELRPNRALLNPDFEGYKLSLEDVPVYKKDLDVGVLRELPDANQYSLLHARLFGLHNHLFGESIDEIDTIYFFDRNLTLQKVSLDPYTNRIDLVEVWKIPGDIPRVGCYNPTLKFISQDLAVVSDGNGFFYILITSLRSNDSSWTTVYSDEIIGTVKFVIRDALLLTHNNRREIHVLLSSIAQNDPTERFFTVLKYVTVAEADDKTWGAIALREITGKGDLHYCHFEPNASALYLASDVTFAFTVDSENPIKIASETTHPKKTYTWSQTNEEITIKFGLPQPVDRDGVKIDTKSDEISVVYSNSSLLSGNLYQTVDCDLTTWTIKDDLIEVVLSKREEGLMWPELVPGDCNGEFVVDTCIVDEVHNRLQHLCSDTEATPQSGTTFNTQQVEECDFEDDKNIVFERISVDTHEPTHRINLGSNGILLTVQLYENLPPAVAIRSDVDGCLWQPHETADGFCLKHEGTLLAFGYVQASKQQRKFTVCAPDLSYSAICDSSRHVFIYRQKKAVTGGELKNRMTGKKVNNVAQQQVVNISNDEVLGVFATNSRLYMLTENCIYALNIR